MVKATFWVNAPVKSATPPAILTRPVPLTAAFTVRSPVAYKVPSFLSALWTITEPAPVASIRPRLVISLPPVSMVSAAA